MSIEKGRAVGSGSQEVMDYVCDLLGQLARDWDYSQAIGPDTRLFSDLGFESLEAVIVGTAIQEHYQREMPFAELLADVGQREIRDLTIGELVEFVNKHMHGITDPGGSMTSEETQ